MPETPAFPARYGVLIIRAGETCRKRAGMRVGPGKHPIKTGFLPGGETFLKLFSR